MDHNPQTDRYEQLYEELRSHAVSMHERNKAMIKWGSIGLIVIPIVLLIVRWLTDSDKMVFLLLWIFCLFALAAFLIGVEYLDHTIQKTLNEMTDREEEFDDLLQPHRELPGKIKNRVSALQEHVDIQERMKMYKTPGTDDSGSDSFYFKGSGAGEDGDDGE